MRRQVASEAPIVAMEDLGLPERRAAVHEQASDPCEGFIGTTGEQGVLREVAAVVAIASKFLIRQNGKHVFNPTNFSLVVISIASGGDLWVSPGQWGSGASLLFFLACAGMLVVHRSQRSDITWAFLAAYAGVLALRTAWLGDPWSVPLHALESGALWLFAFFMISDPKTTPDSRGGRIVYACLVALGAAFVHFVLFRSNGLLWALFVVAPTVPVIDRLMPAIRFQWPGQRCLRSRAGSSITPIKGELSMTAPTPALASASTLEPSVGFTRMGLCVLLIIPG